MITASGDLDGDGRGDLVWRHRVSGFVYLFLMDGGALVAPGGRRAPPCPPVVLSDQTDLVMGVCEARRSLEDVRLGRLPRIEDP